MLVSDKLIFLELHKTGCTHTRNIFSKIPSVGGERFGNHNGYYNSSKSTLNTINFFAKEKIGTIRNPWSWYVSLWAFGCMKKGGLYHQLTSKNGYTLKKKIKNPERIFYPSKYWEKLYEDPFNESNFRTWLQMLLTKNRIPVSNNYKNFAISKTIGFLTFRAIQLYTRNSKQSLLKLNTLEEVTKFYDQNNYMDVIIKNEQIESYFIENSEKYELSIPEMKSVLNSFPQKSNASKHHPYKSYYDSKTQDLVAQKDAWVIKKFKYNF